jgi:hypothetical protein
VPPFLKDRAEFWLTDRLADALGHGAANGVAWIDVLMGRAMRDASAHGILLKFRTVPALFASMHAMRRVARAHPGGHLEALVTVLDATAAACGGGEFYAGNARWFRQQSTSKHVRRPAGGPCVLASF